LFKPPAAATAVVPAMGDRELRTLLDLLDGALLRRSPAPTADEASRVLWHFGRRMQASRLSSDQEAIVLARLDAIGRARPAYGALVEQPAFMVRTLTVGKRAPDIRGRDLTGAPLALHSLRGRAVVLSFSAEWCGICKTQFPYFRLLEDLYGNWPLSIVSVETGSSPEVAQRIKSNARLTFASWWDPPTDASTHGAIAAAWRVTGWPSLYVLDGDGVIRFVDVRDEELLKAVRQVLDGMH
jgi:peroxiredoxin